MKAFSVLSRISDAHVACYFLTHDNDFFQLSCILADYYEVPIDVIQFFL